MRGEGCDQNSNVPELERSNRKTSASPKNFMPGGKSKKGSRIRMGEE